MSRYTVLHNNHLNTSEPEVLEVSRSVTNFLNISGVPGILCSFRIVLKGKASKVMSDKILSNNFPLSDAEDNTSEPLDRGGIADLPL